MKTENNHPSIRRTMDGVQICFGDHPPDADCEWCDYVPYRATVEQLGITTEAAEQLGISDTR